MGGRGRAPISSFPIISRLARRSRHDRVRAVARPHARLCRHRHLGPRRASSAPAPMPRDCWRRMAGASRSPASSSRRSAAARRRLPSAARSCCARKGLTLLMLTLVVDAMLYEAANKASVDHRRRGRARRHECVAGAGLPLRPLRQDRLLVLPRRVVRVLARRARDRAFAVRALAHRHPRERAAHARDRLAGVLAAPHHLHDLGGDGRRRRRADRADDAPSSGWTCSSFDRSGDDPHHADPGRRRAAVRRASSACRST